MARTLLESGILSVEGDGASQEICFQPFVEEAGSSHALQINISCDNISSFEIANWLQEKIAFHSTETFPLTLLDKFSKMRLSEGAYAPKFRLDEHDHRQGVVRVKKIKKLEE